MIGFIQSTVYHEYNESCQDYRYIWVSVSNGSKCVMWYSHRPFGEALVVTAITFDAYLCSHPTKVARTYAVTPGIRPYARCQVSLTQMP